MRPWQPRFKNIVVRRIVESESQDLHVLDRSRSTFFRFNEVGVANRSRFFRFGVDGNRILHCIWKPLFTLNYFTFLRFKSIFCPLDSQECDEGAVHRQAIKQLPRSARGDAKISLSDRNY